MLTFCITGDELRKALADIEAAEKNGFKFCLAVFDITSAGHDLDACRATYSDLYEKAHPTDPRLNWGRFQRITKRFRFRGGKLVAIRDRASTSARQK